MPNMTEADRYIERVGIFFESMGISQMGRRILGFLLISDNPLQSLTDITNRLGVSKSSISTAMKTLIAITMVIKKGRPGSRMDFYEVNPNLFRSAISAKTDATVGFQKIIKEALGFNKVENERKILLTEMVFFYDFFLEEYPKIFDKWEIYRQQLIAENKISP